MYSIQDHYLGTSTSCTIFTFIFAFFLLVIFGIDGSYQQSGISDSRSIQGIALGPCHKSDGMIFSSPHSKELYVSSNYKLDEGHHTPMTFNPHYDGRIFIGLHNHNSSTSFEPYPEGTSVSFTLPSPS